jgi:ABC-type amino acid transport substrate-binding protein
MKQHSNIVLILLLSFAAAIVAVYLINPPRRGESGQVTAPVTTAETSYERVIRTGTLRCGYEYWDGGIMKDDVSGQLKGPWTDILNDMGTALSLKVEWVSRVGYADVSAALKSGKIDAFCSGIWTSAAKAKEISFSTPLAYQAMEAFVRGDDHRFDDNLSLLDDPGVKLAVIDNDNSDFITQQDFPKAQKDSLGTLNGSDSQLLMDVLTGKADATFTDAGQWRGFDKTNPGKIRRLAPDKKLRVFGLAVAVNNDDPRMLSMIDAAAEEIQNSGFVDKTLDQANQQWPDMYIKPLKPYP